VFGIIFVSAKPKNRIIDMALFKIFLRAARNIFAILPISLGTRLRIKNQIFSILGERASSLPGYHDWKRRSDNNAGIISAPAEPVLVVWEKHYASDVRPTFVFISHDVGGGTEQHVLFLKNALAREGIRILALRHSEPKSNRLLLHGFAPDATARMEFDISNEKDSLLFVLRSGNVQHIHVHHTLHMPENILSFISSISKELGVRYDYTAHDYLSICPRFTLYQDGTGGYCGEPDIKGCAGCLATYGSDYGHDIDMHKWRKTFEVFLHGARRVFTPDDDVSRRLKRYFPEAAIQTRPHEEIFSSIETLAGERKNGEALKVVVLGAIAPHKGASIIFDCAQDALNRNLNIHFTVIGYTSEDWKRKPLSNMTITGGYTDEQLTQWIKNGKFHLSFFPAVWPETYSYTLSLAMRFGLHPVAFDLGAIGRRIIAAGFGSVLPYADFRFPSKINDALLAIKPAQPPADLMQKNFVRYASYTKEYYELKF
jgi:glycosyltransferase involved in cell wall biosynthesis